MLIYIPVSYETIVASTGTPTMYGGALPVWSTRPMEIEITMDAGHGVLPCIYGVLPEAVRQRQSIR